VFDNPHYEERVFFTSMQFGEFKASMPPGYLCKDGRRLGVRSPATSLGEQTDIIMTSPVEKEHPDKQEVVSRRPLAELVVLDLGIIVAGGELGRLFVDQRATVIKVENKANVDGLRQSLDGNPVSFSFAQGDRGKRSFGLNLRSAKGIEIFKQLAAKADIVLTKFKPGTTQSLGIDYQSLKLINPAIIYTESSAMGANGCDSKTMGYGALVRASTGPWLVYSATQSRRKALVTE